MKKHIKSFWVSFGAITSVFFYLARKGVWSSPARYRDEGNTRGLTILGNGPSLNNDIDKALSCGNQDYVGLNYMGCTSMFLRVKPRWYYLMDRAFFVDSDKNRRRDDILSLYKTFNQNVDWEMTIVIPSIFINDFKNYSQIDNPLINVKGVNTNPFNASLSLRHWIYKRNWGIPRPQNVTILAIYCGINMGYKNIYLYGVDHTFIQDICVDEENRLCLKWDHFYDKNPVLKPVVDTLGGIPTIASELFTIAITFRSHEILREYADYIGCRIVNCTKGSMIDSYIRESQLH